MRKRRSKNYQCHDTLKQKRFKPTNRLSYGKGLRTKDIQVYWKDSHFFVPVRSDSDLRATRRELRNFQMIWKYSELLAGIRLTVYRCWWNPKTKSKIMRASMMKSLRDLGELWGLGTPRIIYPKSLWFGKPPTRVLRLLGLTIVSNPLNGRMMQFCSTSVDHQWRRWFMRLVVSLLQLQSSESEL